MYIIKQAKLFVVVYSGESHHASGLFRREFIA